MVDVRRTPLVHQMLECSWGHTSRPRDGGVYGRYVGTPEVLGLRRFVEQIQRGDDLLGVPPRQTARTSVNSYMLTGLRTS